MAQDNQKAPIGLSPPLNTTLDNVKINPDDLFARNTILEIRGIQSNLRADAEAKREELRLMVGERYRDLLQASSSIISMSHASMQVKTALEDVKDTILSQDAPPPPKRTSIRGLDDTHLHVFQLLSAHMKLLLDAPEHLWRLMERKKYFVAAWLFLLTRAVHRALVKESDQDDGAWSSKGVDVVEQFPIVQRQWEVVSQLRTQIVHKATLALREVSISPEEACAMMLTLHILDSRPMLDALVVFLEQRSKSLRTSLQWKPEHTSLSDSRRGTSIQANGSAMPSSQKITLQEVKVAIHAALDTLFSTISVGRQIFYATASAQPLMNRVLEHIQAGSSSSAVNDTNASDLYLTSQSLLSSLPSSTHFLLLPANIRNYKPFIDTNSQSTNVSQTTLDQKLDAWFSKSVDFVHNAIEKWLGGLQTIKEVWRMRLTSRAWTESSDLLPAKKEKLGQVFDGTYGKRISDIWGVKLIETQKIFEEALATLSAGEDDATDGKRDQLASLFQAQPLSTQILKGPDDVAFKKYKSALVKQLSGRTAKLDTLVTSLEQCAELIQQDIGQIRSANTYQSSELLDQLRQTYQPNADALCHAVFQSLDSVARQSRNDLGKLVLVNQLSMELGHSSSFIQKIECSPEVVQEFQSNMHALHSWILEQWQERTMSQVLVKTEPDIIHTQTEPSYRLIQELGMLCHALCQLGFGHRSTEHAFISKTLYLFVTRKLASYPSHNGSVVPLGDMVFLRKLAELRPQTKDLDDLITTLDEHIVKHPSNPQVHTNVLSILTRTQVLLAPLLPASALKDVEGRSSMLLPYGLLPSDQQYRPPLELAKSSSRFGLLLVGGSTTVS